MAAAQTHALPDQRFPLVGIEHVGEDDHQRAARLPPAEVGERIVVVGLGLAGLDRTGGVEKATQLRGAGARRQRAGDRVGEGEHPGAIAGAKRDVHEQQRRIDRVVQLGELARADAHQPAVIQADHQRLRTLGDELGGHEAPGARGGAPVDGAQRVVGKRLAHALELAALGAQSHGAKPELGELTAPRQRLVHVDGSEIRIDPHCARSPRRWSAASRAPTVRSTRTTAGPRTTSPRATGVTVYSTRAGRRTFHRVRDACSARRDALVHDCCRARGSTRVTARVTRLATPTESRSLHTRSTRSAVLPGARRESTTIASTHGDKEREPHDEQR